MKVTENQERLLKDIVQHFDLEDRSVRERQIRTWRRLKFFWDGFQRVWYSEVAHDWRVSDESSSDDSDQSYYDKPVNIFRAYLESIIAALSVTVPPITCYPDDADNALDISTAKAGEKIAQLIYRHNNVSYLWMHSLFIYCTEGLVACYNYTEEDEKYGTYEEKKYENEQELHQIKTCPLCNQQIEDNTITDEFQPGEDSEEMEQCPNCNQPMVPQSQEIPFEVRRLVGVNKLPKSRQCLESYGGLYVKVPVYAKSQKDMPYLSFRREVHFSIARSRFPKLYKDIKPGDSGLYEPYERWGRLSTQYQGEYPTNNVTINDTWLRPCAFDVLEDEEESKSLRKLFPNGCKVSLVNEHFADVSEESLDDHWKLTHNPLSDYIHHDPIGLLLTSLQEITNDMVSLTLQTIEHGIPQTFADPAVLNFEAYRNSEVSPGSIFPAIPKSGKSMSDAFYEVRTATLSTEVMPFTQQIQTFAQLVSGALPSLFGGSMGESKTASEYSMSRSQALQRLNSTWKTFCFWWKEIFGNAIPAYIKEVHEDERFVTKDKFGNFANILIAKAELEGKIGNIELEANENLPITHTQLREIIMQLLQANNPEIQKALAEPENLPLMREALGLTDFYIGGEDDRNKQYEEIQQLLNSEPISQPSVDPMTGAPQIDPMTGQPVPDQQLPSVEIDPDFDNHQIQFEICKKWITGDVGRIAKVNNEAGYANVLLHAKMHLQVIQQQAMMQAQSLAQGSGAQPFAKPTEQDKDAPITGEQDVPVQ